MEVEGGVGDVEGGMVLEEEMGRDFMFQVEMNEMKNSGTHPGALLDFRRQMKSLE